MLSAGLRTDDFNLQIKDTVEQSLAKLKIHADCYNQLSKELEKNMQS